MPDLAPAPSREDIEKLIEMQRRLDEATSAADHYRTGVHQLAQLCGLSLSSGQDPIQAIASSIKSLKETAGSASQSRLPEDPSNGPRQDAFLHLMLSERNLEAVDLRRELSAALGAADPNVVQLKQLMLDPALNREFVRLRTELEASKMELRAAKVELAASTFSPESELGKKLVAKCRALADENEEMAKGIVKGNLNYCTISIFNCSPLHIATDLSEGRVHQLETQLAMAREYASEMRAQTLELEEHCTVMDEELEELQMEAFALRKEVADLKSEAAAARDRDRDREVVRAPDGYGGRRLEGGPPPGPPPLRGGVDPRDRGGDRDRDRDRFERDRDRGVERGGVIASLKRGR